MGVGADEEAGEASLPREVISAISLKRDLQVGDDAVADDGGDPGVDTPAGRRWKAGFSPSMTTVCQRCYRR